MQMVGSSAKIVNNHMAWGLYQNLPYGGGLEWKAAGLLSINKIIMKKTSYIIQVGINLTKSEYQFIHIIILSGFNFL